ncbi:MAG: hypothetical protein KDB46_08575 [Solirubrobacterales bacterium]|nr:hypothetical protein [Solirubrobacterales bacterium]
MGNLLLTVPEPEPAFDTREEAEEACGRLARTHPDRKTHSFLPRRRGDGWAVAKVALAPPAHQLGTETRADERPPTPDDPRSAHYRNAGPYAGT